MPVLGLDSPPLDAILPAPSPAGDGSPTLPPEDGTAGFSNQHGGWPQHGPGGAICWVYGLNLISSMERWPGYRSLFNTGTGISTNYQAEFMWYQGYLGWRDANGNMQYRLGVALGGFDELKSTSTRTWAWVDNRWQQTAILANSQTSGYYGYGSNATLPFPGTFWTWVYHYWGPIDEGTPERPGARVFNGAGHFDYLGEYACS